MRASCPLHAACCTVPAALRSYAAATTYGTLDLPLPLTALLPLAVLVLQGEGGANARPTSGPLGGSKKDPEVRRRELLSGGGAASLAASLAALCSEQAGRLIRSQHGSDVLVEVCRGGEGGLLAECLEGGAEALAPVHDALVVAAAGTDGAAGSGEEEQEEGGSGGGEPVLSHFFGSRALRRLVLASGDGGAAGAAAAAFVGKLWSGALQGNCKQWVDTHAAKVLAALLHCGDPAVVKAARSELKPLVKGSLDEWAAKLTTKQQPQQPKQPKLKQQPKQQPQKQQKGSGEVPASKAPVRKAAAAAKGGKKK